MPTTSVIVICQPSTQMVTSRYKISRSPVLVGFSGFSDRLVAVFMQGFSGNILNDL